MLQLGKSRHVAHILSGVSTTTHCHPLGNFTHQKTSSTTTKTRISHIKPYTINEHPVHSLSSNH
jgi:hypothetical protein